MSSVPKLAPSHYTKPITLHLPLFYRSKQVHVITKIFQNDFI